MNKNRFANFNLSSHAQGLNNIGIAKGKQESPTILGSFFFRSSLLDFFVGHAFADFATNRKQYEV